MPEKPQNIEQEIDEKVQWLVLHDLTILEGAANRLQRLGWTWFFGFSVLFLFLLMLVGVGQLRALVPALLLGLLVLGISLFYFGLARYIARGRQWAIGLSLFVVSLLVAVLLYRICTPRPLRLPLAIFETVYLLATLGLFKSLFQSWGAARRLHRFANRLPVREYGLVDEHQ